MCEERNPYRSDFEAAQGRISALESEMCDDCRKKAGLPPKLDYSERKPTEGEEIVPPLSETKKKLRKMALIAFYSALVPALFWGIWLLFAPVPALTEIVWSKGTVWHLPFAISRWWDVLFAPIYALLISSVPLFVRPYILAKYPTISDDDLNAGLGAGLVWLGGKVYQFVPWFIALNKKVFRL